MASKIRLISSSLVYAVSTDHNKESNTKIELTAWDLRVLPLDPIQKGLLFHKPKPSQPENTLNLIHRLKTSLSRTVDFFPPLAGRLATVEYDDNMTSFYIDCNNRGAEFIHAAANGVFVADIIESVYVPQIVNSFFPLNGGKNYEGHFKPLLAVQVTELVDGIFIGCTMNHTVGDGSSFWYFFNSWSEISRGSYHLFKPPVLQHYTDTSIRIPLLSKKQLSNRLITFTQPMEQRVFHFTKENIAKLKAKANGEIGTNKISSLQAVLSHLWRSAVRNKCLDDDDLDQDVHYVLVVGVRQRSLPFFPMQYFGNANQGVVITMKARELLEKGLGYVAWQMNKMVVMHMEEKLRKLLLESWEEKAQLITFDNFVSNNALVTSSSPKFDVYGNNFGWGRPIAVRSGPTSKSDGKITLFAGTDEGSIDIEACFLPETLQGMENDKEFMNVIQ